MMRMRRVLGRGMRYIIGGWSRLSGRMKPARLSLTS
jgi:hypothetical protein